MYYFAVWWLQLGLVLAACVPQLHEGEDAGDAVQRAEGVPYWWMVRIKKAMIHHILFLPCIAVGYTTRNPTVTQEPSVKRSRKLLNLPNLHFSLRGIKLDYQSQQSKLLCSQVICGKICFEKETEDKEGKWWVGRY